ncbi:hypothetical protein [Kineococcus radiotolerans]|uniref:Uncharacterized protein n=1 Tax=Kineococcus radiotolerans (strain ATCC BAA-149 / DSM 14245 / SRS30216) TaxID=266940 RepID=A6WGM2_KINRD|nr:hypothetical protein [Kineococcus radiotolerans]ABS05961.1 hypothetical protein Krad_4502 [Kineococcus radiotolerans SRS30216 = ATCC BAA-149]
MSETFGGNAGDGAEEPLSPEEQRVRALLRAAADVGPVPDDVVARLDAALAAARADTPVASLAARRRRPRLPRLLTAAAGILVIGGGAVLAVQHEPSSDSASGSSAADSAAVDVAAPPEARVLVSGRDYTDAAAVEDLAEETLEEEAAEATGGGGRAPDATSGTDATAPGRTLLKAPSGEASATSDPAQRPVAERALACTKSLGVDPVSVLAVEIASWRTVPAALVVHRSGDGAEVVVVALDCVPGDAAYSRVDVPLPAGS